VDDGLGNLTVVIVDVAHAGVANPAEKVARTVANFLFAHQDMFHLPACVATLPASAARTRSPVTSFSCEPSRMIAFHDFFSSDRKSPDFRTQTSGDV